MLRGIMILGLFLCLVGSADAATIYVPDDYPTIQGAINAAVNGDTVIVRPGTYVENIDFTGKSIDVKSESGPDVTIIDGGQPSNPDYGSVAMFISGEGLDSILQGFTLTNGTGTYESSYQAHYGGGIFCNNGSSPTITDNIIRDNSIIGSGGGISCWYSSPAITGNKILNNSGRDGGGIHITFSSDPLVRNNIITGNHTYYMDGGGINIARSSPTIIFNLITDNKSSNSGGGINTNSYCYAIIACNTVMNNTADRGGGGIAANDSPPTVSGNLIAGNSAAVWGGGFYTYNGSPTTSNNTITGNSAGQEGGGFYCYSYSATISNSIIWGNDAPVKPELGENIGNLTVSYCDIKGGWTGTGNIDADPLFVDPANKDLHLTYDSPCKDTGDNSAVTEPFDFEGDPRIAYGTADMGADEFHPHLYYGGSVVPGGTIRIRIIGVPGTSPIWLGQGTGVLDPPMFTQYGKLYLEQPFVDVWSLGSIPSNGVRTTYLQTVPVTWLSGEQYPFQALVGPKAPGSVLTNLMVLTVE